MTTIIHILPEISKGIWDKAKAKPKLGGRKGKCMVPAETILAMRRMHEIENKSYRQVANAYGMSYRYTLNVLQYIVRADLRLGTK